MLQGSRPADLDYLGFVEGDDIGKGTVDVVVTEGFAGNIALKTAEGTARQIAAYLREAMSAHPHGPASAICWRAAPSSGCGARWIPRRVNGGVFLGLNGIVIKSHGGTDAEGFAAAIEIGYSMVRNGPRREDQPGSRGAIARRAGPRATERSQTGAIVTCCVRSSSAAAAICPRRS